uniref:Carboxylesterase type B domain-containing protein n=1 Tax=Romanomermis culicivorax TaxID=13658 RepID=A0A915IV58_ROMCU
MFIDLACLASEIAEKTNSPIKIHTNLISRNVNGLFVEEIETDVIAVTQTGELIIRLSDQSLLRGLVQETSSATNRSILTFLGVPYAAPPIGSLRFAPPRSPAPWRGVYNATRQPNACMQTNITNFYRAQSKEPYGYSSNLSEDCLYLNIWAPVSPEGQISYNANRTIMVYIHGGSFVMGSITNSLLDGRVLSSEAIHEDVIVITINYRLNIFGFLYAGNELSPGNMGLLDQLEALRWIRQNARHIGGNPDDVVLFGLSAGARSISLHLVSEMSRPYYSRVILQSGSSLCPWTFTPKDEMLDKVLNLAHFVNCSTNESDLDKKLLIIVQCLKQVPAQKLIDYETVNKRQAGTTWTATLDGQFLTDDPEILMQEGRFQKKDVLFGTFHA